MEFPKFSQKFSQYQTVPEVADLRPDCTHLKNLFRLVQPSYLVISSGSKWFLEELLELLQPSDGNADINKYKVKKNSTANANASNLSIYPFDRAGQEALRKKIYDLDLPGLVNPSACSASDRQIFINSTFPMNQDLFVIALGNLLRYLSENVLKWRHTFLGLEKKLIVTNVIVTILQSQVLLDDTTYNSLNIFSVVYHPSSFKLQIRKDGLSLYNMLNHCCSSNGSQELKNMLKQPTRHLTELNLRLNTVEWCLKPENSDHVTKIKHFLNGFVNINAALQRIINNFGKTNDWKSFKRTVYHVSSICEICASLPEQSVCNTFIEKLADYCRDGLSVNGILYALDKIVDLEAIDEKKRFVVKKGFDGHLDKKREELNSFVEECSRMAPDDSLMKISNAPSSFQTVYYPEVGFLIATSLKLDQLNMNSSLNSTNETEIFFKTDDAIYFKTANCTALNRRYDEQLTEIITIEMEVFQKLINYINENFNELAEISKICAVLDCLIAFAKIAEKYHYIRPNITKERKLEIIQGRHPLIEQMKPYIPSTTIINDQHKDFINIIRAPNSSGKSVYVKQLALICYLAHIGCFVPASDTCNIPLLHSIYTRIYTPESIYNNESAFMSDLQQMSKTIMSSTSRSLILIDEFGKGTNYKDGIALLTATIEHFIERGKDFVPFIFITTHYPQVYQLLRTKELVNLKTVMTKKNEQNIFQSTYRIVDGTNEQVCTEFPESKKIISNIFHQKERDEELKKFNQAYSTSIKAFILVLSKMMLRKGHVTYEFIKDIYSNVSIENFLNRSNL